MRKSSSEWDLFGVIWQAVSIPGSQSASLCRAASCPPQNPEPTTMRAESDESLQLTLYTWWRKTEDSLKIRKEDSPSHNFYNAARRFLPWQLGKKKKEKASALERKVWNYLTLHDLVAGESQGRHTTRTFHTHTTHSITTSKPVQHMAGHEINTRKPTAFTSVSSEQSEMKLRKQFCLRQHQRESNI